jgi:hypothetical protein
MKQQLKFVSRNSKLINTQIVVPDSLFQTYAKV